MPILIGRPLTRHEFAGLAQHVAQLSGGKGWRQPGRKIGSTSLVQRASFEAGWITERGTTQERSKRGLAREEARLKANARTRDINAHGVQLKYRNAHGSTRWLRSKAAA
ncbi:hypothetical protein [Xanthobacter sp.]|uniref:hypothetical protein n=1 Tax=Xanthobacter sp. TaxID=35809 RepID=UPI0025E7DBB2|nr:hypothetical protein [Xanthobacter sp.]